MVMRGESPQGRFLKVTLPLDARNAVEAQLSRRLNSNNIQKRIRKCATRTNENGNTFDVYINPSKTSSTRVSSEYLRELRLTETNHEWHVIGEKEFAAAHGTAADTPGFKDTEKIKELYINGSEVVDFYSSLVDAERREPREQFSEIIRQLSELHARLGQLQGRLTDMAAGRLDGQVMCLLGNALNNLREMEEEDEAVWRSALRAMFRDCKIHLRAIIDGLWDQYPKLEDEALIDVLIFVCEPEGFPLDEAQAEAHMVAERFEQVNGIKIHVQLGGSAKDMRDLLYEHRPAVLHFIGHSDAMHPRTGRPTLGFTNERGGLETIDDRTIQRMLVECAKGYPKAGGRRLQFVFMNGCLSAQLCQHVCACSPLLCIAWSTLVHDTCAMTFAEGFYKTFVSHVRDALVGGDVALSTRVLQECVDEGKTCIDFTTHDGVDAYGIGNPQQQEVLEDGRLAAGIPEVIGDRQEEASQVRRLKVYLWNLIRSRESSTTTVAHQRQRNEDVASRCEAQEDSEIQNVQRVVAEARVNGDAISHHNERARRMRHSWPWIIMAVMIAGAAMYLAQWNGQQMATAAAAEMKQVEAERVAALERKLEEEKQRQAAEKIAAMEQAAAERAALERRLEEERQRRQEEEARREADHKRESNRAAEREYLARRASMPGAPDWAKDMGSQSASWLASIASWPSRHARDPYNSINTGMFRPVGGDPGAIFAG